MIKTDRKILLRHLGNMGDLVFFVPPILETLKRKYPACQITFVTAWGYKTKRGFPRLIRQDGSLKIERPRVWGARNQDGFNIHLLATNPHIDHLIHYDEKRLSLEAKICCEDGQCYPTWNRRYYNEQKNSGHYDYVYELDFGLAIDENPIARMYNLIGLPQETYSNYQIYLTDQDREIASAVMKNKPHPRIILLEGLDHTSTRGWDPDKTGQLEQAIRRAYKTDPIWFGAKFIPSHNNQPLTLRQNIATLTYADTAIGVLSGPLHFAAAVQCPTLTLFCDQPLHRSAPAYFLNQYLAPSYHHRTLLGPSSPPYHLLKNTVPPAALTPAQTKQQHYYGWQQPGLQCNKNCLAPITVDEVMAVLAQMVNI